MCTVNGLPDLPDLLLQLETIAYEVRTNSKFCDIIQKQLEWYGYKWFDVKFLPGIDKRERVMKVFAVAVNEAIQKKVNLVNLNTEIVKTELCSLLGIDENKSPSQYFSLPSQSTITMGSLNASSPLDMAEYLKKSAPQWLVKNIIQHEFEMTSWHTFTGKPTDYTFYEFCDKENTKEFLKYIPRLAHVKATLYKECRRSDAFLHGFTKEELCLKVFIRSSKGWKVWDAVTDTFSDCGWEPLPWDLITDNYMLQWIDESIKTFIEENADEQADDDLRLKQALSKPTLYWAVLNDRDFKPGNALKLKKIGQTQVYVGKANNGIRGRWMKDSDNHSEMMKKCLDNVCAMTTYDPLRLEGIQLVDARLALAKIRGENTALFVIKTFGDDVEKAEIVQQKAEASFHAAYWYALQQQHTQPLYQLTATALSLQSTNNPLPDEVEKRQEELDEAKAVVKELKDLKTTKSEAEGEGEVQLTRAEKWHRMGKRDDQPSKNIIPYRKYRMTWKPTNMGYGMNKN